MKIVNVIPQVYGGTRVLLVCPRGRIGVDYYADGEIEVDRLLGARAATARDLREARRMADEAMADD